MLSSCYQGGYHFLTALLLLWLIHTAGEGVWDQWILIISTEMFTLVQDRKRNQNPLFPIVLVRFSVPIPVKRFQTTPIWNEPPKIT